MKLYGIPENPIPNGAVCDQIIGRDGVRLRFARWRPTGRRHKGTVCLFGGRGEQIEKYFETIAELRRRGFAVATLDWRGQGGSDRLLANPRKGHVDHFSDFDDDLNRFMEEIVLPDCPAPYFALAHSMGGTVLMRAARRRDCWFDRIVLTSPMVALAGPVAQSKFAMRLAEVLAFLGFGESFVPGGSATPTECSPFHANPLTSDAKRHHRNCEIVQQTPQLGLGSPTIQWLYAARLAMRGLAEPEFPENVFVPLLMLGAGDDKIVSSRATERLASEMRSGSYIMLPGARHEILMERDEIRSLFWAAFDAFVPGTPLYE
jgi:lysophospholipase